MKTNTYIILLAAVTLVSACASSRELSKNREIVRAEQQQAVINTIESGNYVIMVNKIFTRRYTGMDLQPQNNYLVIENNKARINLAYIGRSYTTKAVSAINVTGIVEEKTITPKKKGSNLVSMRIRGGGELFNVNVRISATGHCTVNINNARLDNVSYRGKIDVRP